ncbi:MAG: XRE family transcriptional regulator [Spirochaetales bacterium]|nr:MAG: XRE family transcriptional regulator [Spirochaetales bacterium]
MEPISEPLVGRNIKIIRKQQNLTLGVLSEKSGVSKTMLSQIEAEKVNPTVAMIWKIAQGLGVEITELLQGSGEPPRKFNVTRKDTVTVLNAAADAVQLHVLSPVSLVEDLEMYLLTFKPQGSLTSKPHFPRTEEFITVLRGAVEVTAGSHTACLEKGDFISYHCDVNHEIRNAGDGDAEIHMVVRFNKRQLDT